MTGDRGGRGGTAGGVPARPWRRRGNPLRRPEDTAEAWVLLVTWVVVVVGGVLVGLLAGHAADREFARQYADRQPVTAVLLDDASPGTATDANGYRALTLVGWTAPDGSARAERALVTSGLPSGASVTLWQDGRGVLAAEPPGPTERRLGNVFFGGAATLTLTCLACGTMTLTRRRLDRRRDARWDAEWELVGPRWDQRTS